MACADGPVMMANLPASTYENDATLLSTLCEECFGKWTWKRSDDGLNNLQASHCTHSLVGIDSIADCNGRIRPRSNKHQSIVSGKCNAFNTRAYSSHAIQKQLGPSDNSNFIDEGDEMGGMRKVRSSKKLMSEHNRRKKLNERLYSPRALVPNISKSLQNQVDKTQEDIVDLETHEGPAVVGSGDEDPKNNKIDVAGFQQQKAKLEHWIVELEVSQMEEHIYHLRIQCKKTLGVLVMLTRAIEALELEVHNASIASVDDHILNTVVVEVKNGSVTKSKELRNMALEMVSKFGFSFC